MTGAHTARVRALLACSLQSATMQPAERPSERLLHDIPGAIIRDS